MAKKKAKPVETVTPPEPEKKAWKEEPKYSILDHKSIEELAIIKKAKEIRDVLKIQLPHLHFGIGAGIKAERSIHAKSGREVFSYSGEVEAVDINGFRWMCKGFPAIDSENGRIEFIPMDPFSAFEEAQGIESEYGSDHDEITD